MALWESPEQKSRREAQEATRRALERGQIPYKARHRLELQRQSGDRFFTSDLTCREYLLTREAGYDPIGLVMGTAFYKVSFWGYFNSYRSFTGELTQLSHAQLSSAGVGGRSPAPRSQTAGRTWCHWGAASDGQL